MFLSMNWISDFVDLSGLDKLKLINQFSLSTAEVENDIFFKGSDLSGVVVAEIKSVEIIPDSKKLHLLKVDAGEAELTDVVCGAPRIELVGKSHLQKLVQKSARLKLLPVLLQAICHTVCAVQKRKSAFPMITAVLWKSQ